MRWSFTTKSVLWRRHLSTADHGTITRTLPTQRPFCTWSLKTLENGLKTAGIAPAATPNDQPVNRQLPSTGLPVQQRANPNAFAEEQITEIKRLVQDSVAAAARDIVREAARAATGVLQSQAPFSSQVTPSAQAVSQDTPEGDAILGPQEQQQPLQTLQSLQPNDGSLTSTPCRHGAPF